MSGNDIVSSIASDQPLQEQDPRRAELIRDEASEWFLRLRDKDLPPADRRRFVQWLKQSPVHIAEIMRLARLYQQLQRRSGAAAHRGTASQSDPERDSNVIELKPAALERLEVYNAWSIVESATARDLALWAEAGLPAKSRMELASKPMLDLPDERTLQFMAKYERERRSKRSERIWWAVGLIATGLLSPIVVELVKGL